MHRDAQLLLQAEDSSVDESANASNARQHALTLYTVGETFGTEDPRTGEIYTQVAEAQEADVDAAVKAARMVCTLHLLFQTLTQRSNAAGACTRRIIACLSRYHAIRQPYKFSSHNLCLHVWCSCKPGLLSLSAALLFFTPHFVVNGLHHTPLPPASALMQAEAS